MTQTVDHVALGAGGFLGPLRILYYIVVVFSFGLFANGVFLATAFVWPVAPLLAYEINSQTAAALWWYMQKVFEDKHKAVITYSGDGIPDGENAIVMANHLSYSDFYLINSVALRKGMLPYCRWFAKGELKWQLPIFGLSMYLMGMVMVSRDWLRDATATREVFLDLKKPEGKGKRVWLVTFLEGTRRTDRKLGESQKFSQEREKPVLQNVLFPRTKGFVAAVQELRGSQVTHVYDFTLAYHSAHKGFGHPALLSTIHSRSRLTPPYRFHVHVRRWAISSLPNDDQGLTRWAEDVWLEKDRILQGMKEGGRWTHWDGLVGYGAYNDGRSGACGVYRDDYWPKTGTCE